MPMGALQPCCGMSIGSRWQSVFIQGLLVLRDAAKAVFRRTGNPAGVMKWHISANVGIFLAVANKSDVGRLDDG